MAASIITTIANPRTASPPLLPVVCTSTHHCSAFPLGEPALMPSTPSLIKMSSTFASPTSTPSRATSGSLTAFTPGGGNSPTSQQQPSQTTNSPTLVFVQKKKSRKLMEQQLLRNADGALEPAPPTVDDGATRAREHCKELCVKKIAMFALEERKLTADGQVPLRTIFRLVRKAQAVKSSSEHYDQNLHNALFTVFGSLLLQKEETLFTRFLEKLQAWSCEHFTVIKNEKSEFVVVADGTEKWLQARLVVLSQFYRLFVESTKMFPNGDDKEQSLAQKFFDFIAASVAEGHMDSILSEFTLRPDQFAELGLLSVPAQEQKKLWDRVVQHETRELNADSWMRTVETSVPTAANDPVLARLGRGEKMHPEPHQEPEAMPKVQTRGNGDDDDEEDEDDRSDDRVPPTNAAAKPSKRNRYVLKYSDRWKVLDHVLAYGRNNQILLSEMCDLRPEKRCVCPGIFHNTKYLGIGDLKRWMEHWANEQDDGGLPFHLDLEVMENPVDPKKPDLLITFMFYEIAASPSVQPWWDHHNGHANSLAAVQLPLASPPHNYAPFEAPPPAAKNWWQPSIPPQPTQTQYHQRWSQTSVYAM